MKKKNIVIFGYGIVGNKVANEIETNKSFSFCGFVDNSLYKQGFFARGFKIMSILELVCLNNVKEINVIIAVKNYNDIVNQLKKYDIKIMGVYLNGRVVSYPFPTFQTIDYSRDIVFYAGDICDEIHLNTENLYGLSINKEDDKHIMHNIMDKYPIEDNSIYRYEAEEVFEYIPQEKLKDVIDEIFRILKPGGVLRICVSDCNSRVIKNRAMYSKNGEIMYDPGAGGTIGPDGVCNGGQVYFATYENLKQILFDTKFKKIEWLCYQTEEGNLVKRNIDMKNGYLNRVNESTEDYCIVVDCYKEDKKNAFKTNELL